MRFRRSFKYRFARFAFVLALAGIPVTAAPPEAPETADDIANYQRVHAGLAVAGAPSVDALASLKARGFKTIINLRLASEPGVSQEEAAVAALGLRYVHVPVSPETFSLADVETVARVLDDAEAAPVLFHCASSNRVGAVMAVIRVQEGVTLEAAEAEGRRLGLKNEAMVEAMKRVAAEAMAARKK